MYPKVLTKLEFLYFKMTPADVSRALAEANEKISNLLLVAKQNSENLPEFVDSGLGPSLGPGIGIIAKLLKDLQIGESSLHTINIS